MLIVDLEEEKGLKINLRISLNLRKPNQVHILLQGTGYRGVGKTSLVNKVLSNAVFGPPKKNKEWSQFIIKYGIRRWKAPVVLELNLGHEQLGEKDVLNLIAKELLEKYSWWYSRFAITFRSRIFKVIIAAMLAFWVAGSSSYLVEIKVVFKRILNGILDLVSLDINILPNSLIHFGTFIFFYQVIRFARTVWFKNSLPNNTTAIRKLRMLNTRIDAEVTAEGSAKISKGFLEIFKGHRTAYPLADIRDIEIELIRIFEYVDRIRFLKPRFIFVFDELDKIEARQNKSLLEKEGYTAKKKKHSTNAEIMRERQEATSKILANLKHFFTTARAKFIFIAGREMYDATLADISDRNYFLGSIFHDVVYVNSFLTEDPEPLRSNAEEREYNNGTKHKSYYHSMAEEFLCQFLMPESFLYRKGDEHFLARLDNPKNIVQGERRKSISLKTYNIYLQNVTELSKEQIYKVILILNQFVTYLAHRSSGSPKKLTHLLESYICQTPEVLEDDNPNGFLKINAIVAGKTSNKKSLYLHFDFFGQYTFGLLNYLTVPYYYNVSRYVRRYNDKLMVSTSYLIDHLYKFHDFGFSWRNLEVTPEIIDVNKAPMLRELIEEIVNFLSYTHLQHVVSGLYDFKFKKKIAYEINFLSKISERESAALNFTLDESQEVKGHFRRKLEDLNQTDDSFVHSKGYLQQSIADLHYYDQEYDDASIMYKDAVQHILKGDKVEEAIPLRLLVLMCRIMLKLGLTFERKKAYTSALMAYTQMSKLIVKSLEIEHIRETPENCFQGIQQLSLNPENYSLYHKSTTSETVRLLYQPFLAKLHIMYKEKISGITDEDIDLVVREIQFMTKITNPTIARKIRSEYYNKIGDILHFINYDKKYFAHKEYQRAILALGGKESSPEEDWNKKMIQILFSHLENADRGILRFEETKIIASNWNDYGDALINSNEESIELDFDQVNAILDCIDESKLENVTIEGLEKFIAMGVVPKGMFCYIISNFFYLKNDDDSKASFQFIKIFHLIELNSSQLLQSIEGNLSKKELKKGFLDKIEKIVKKILLSIYRSYDSSTRQEIERVKNIFKIVEEKELDENFHFILNNLPAISEVQEILSLYQLLHLRFGELPKEDDLLKSIGKYNPSKYANLNGMYGRLNSLNVKVRFNFEILKNHDKINKYFKKVRSCDESVSIYFKQMFLDLKINERALLHYLIADTIYCLTATIRILKIFGVNYITNHSTFAYVYEKRGEWCEMFDHFIQIEAEIRTNTKKRNLYAEVRNLIGAEAMSNLKSRYNYEKAISHYTQALETHQGKFAYDRIAENLYYLEDDFNDIHLHFFVAQERHKIKNKKPEMGKKYCLKKLKPSKIYNIRKYTVN